MRILIAPDAFKESMTASQAAEAMALGAMRAFPSDHLPQIDECPISDGGDGFVDALARSRQTTSQSTTVSGPIGNQVRARWAILDERPSKSGAATLATAVGWGTNLAVRAFLPFPTGGEELDEKRCAIIESAACAGLTLVPDEKRDPENTTSFGIGQLIAAALDRGCGRILIGIGGTATCDGGIGAAQALGIRFLDSAGKKINDGRTSLAGGALHRIASIDWKHVDERIAEIELHVACDVANPLLGEQGAAHIYAPQKGATPEQVDRLEAGLTNLAQACDRADEHVDPETPGAGAGGGLGFGLAAMLGATLHPGADLVLETAFFDERLAEADLVLTGEGRLDAQTSMGKAVGRVAELAGEKGVPVVAIVGSLAPDANRIPFAHIEAASPNGPPTTLAGAMDALEDATARALAQFTHIT